MAENYVLLETIQLTQSATSVTFDSIPQTGYTDLKVVCSSRDDRSGQPNGDLAIQVGYNGTINTGSIYTSRRFGRGGGSVFSDSGSGTSFSFGMSTSTTATANAFGNSEFYIANYTNSTSKIVSACGASENNDTTAFLVVNSGLIATSNPVTEIKIFPALASNFLQYSTFSLYGIASLGTDPVTAPKASGGNIVANDGTYWYHAFLSSGTFAPLTPITCDYLVVAGGGGASRLAGAGAGGLRSTVTATGGGGSLESAISVSTATNVIIGAGGAGCVATGGDTSLRGQNGSDSVFGSITSIGGGGGANGNSAGFTGGSGGGGWNPGAGGAGTTGQGYAGGSAASFGSGVPYGQGGGGGAGAVGQAAQSGNIAGTGGNGVQITAFATPTTTGANSGYYAGGGGGSSDSSVTAKAGGLGGGGAGGGLNAGTVNTGGGGGAQGGVSGLGGAGGSGIVIIRYAIA